MDYKITQKHLLKTRTEVLDSWHTGKNLKLEDGFKFQQTLPQHKQLPTILKNAQKEGKTLLQPRAGLALVPEHIQLLNYLDEVGDADLLPTNIDAYTRLNRYQEAEKRLEKSKQAGISLITGFPAVNHGVKGCRQVVEAVNKPVQIRHGTPDARLLAEITFIAGFTGFEGGAISYNIPYAKSVPLVKSIAHWQYVDRLVGLYEENGISINREPFGPLTGTLIPPCISHAVAIIEGLLALEQGVKSITLGYGQGGNFIQDLAALTSLRELAHIYFKKFGFTDYHLTTVFHQWMGGFPEDEAKAFSVICWGASIASFAKVDKIIVKTPHEAMGIPTKEASVSGLRATRQTLNMLSEQRLDNSGKLKTEIELIHAEVTSIINKIIQIGNGNLAQGVVSAFATGILDIPFAPSIYTRGRILPVRDNEGFVRILQKSQLPFTDDVLNYHREKIQERANAEQRKPSFQMVTDDIYAISKGYLIGRPQ